MRHVVFCVASERFALPLAAVREVVLPQPPFALVPRSSDAVRGVMNLRGRVVAVVDLAALMGLAPQALEAGRRPRPHPRPRQARARVPHRRRARGRAAAPPEGVPAGVVRGVAASSTGAVTVLGAEALAGEAARLFGGR